MFLFYVLSFFKKGDTIQGETLFKGGHYLRKYGKFLLKSTTKIRQKTPAAILMDLEPLIFQN